MRLQRYRREDYGPVAVHEISVGDRLTDHLSSQGSAGNRPPVALRAAFDRRPQFLPSGAAGGASASVTYLRDALASAALAASELRRRIRRTVAAVLAATLSLSGMVAMPAAAMTALPGNTLGNFEQDGNFVVDATNKIDWANQPNVVKITDDLLDSAFRGSSKEEIPGDWVCQNHAGGVTPGKDNVLRAYVNPRINSAGAFLDLAFVKQEGEGDTHVNFEFNREGSVSPYQEGPCGITRSVGDLLFTYDFGGTSDPTATVRVWNWSGSAWSELAADALRASAANNADDLTDPLAGGAGVEARTFGEMTVDLNSIPGFAPSCPGLAFANVRSRSSGESFTSALQDKLPATPVDLSTCGSVSLKKVDDLGKALAGATFGLYESVDATGPAVQQCTTDAAGKCTFAEVAPGTYSVKEIAAPPGYTADPTVVAVTVGHREDAVVERAFVNPLNLGSIKVLKTDEVTGAGVGGVRFELLQNGAVAKTRAGVPATCTTSDTPPVGECTISGLVPGVYTLHEVAATVPPTMTAAPDQVVTIVADSTITVPFVNPVKPLDIALIKLVNGKEAVTVHEGDLLTYTLAVTNTGDVPIDITSLTDRSNGALVTLPATCEAMVSTVTFLAPGASAPVCTYTATAGAADIDNVATVIGTDAFGRTDSATDAAKVTVISPAISLVKTVNGAKTATVHAGDTVTYTLVITNTGADPLTLTSLTDVANGATLDLPGACDALIGPTPLAAGASRTCSYPVTAGTVDIANVATVVGNDDLGRSVTDEDRANVDVINPAITIVKTASPTAISGPSGTVTFTYLVTNTGDTPLTNVRVTDDILGDIGGIARLDPQASTTLTRTATVGSAAPRNVGTAVGTDLLGRTVQATDPEEISFVLGAVIERPADAAPLAGAAPLARTGADADRLMQAALLLLLLGGLALIPEHVRRRADMGGVVELEGRLRGSR